MSSVVSKPKTEVSERPGASPSASRMLAVDHTADRPAPAAPSVLHAASVWITLLVFWLLLSGIYTAFLIAAGVGSALAVTWLAKRMGLIDHEGHPIHLSVRAFFWFWPWLLKEIVKSAWQVTCVILHPKLPISPCIVRFRPSQRSDLGLVIHANSITLTPGTICIEAARDEFVVHALTAEGAAGATRGGDMDRRCARLEGGG